MRPKTLVLEGFRSHRETTEISFEDRALVAIVGPIGAGKSTILDGICYALYAKTPRVQRATRTLICTGSEQARIQLLFEVDGVEYEVTRVISNKSARSGAHIFVDGDTGEKTTGEAAVTRKVEDVLGLDFEAFGSSVLLAQNQFARFLEKDNTLRTNILKGVFRLDQIDRMRDVARDRRDASDRELATLTGELGAIPDDIEERLARLEEEIAAIEARRNHLRDALQEEKRLTGKHEESAAVLAAAEQALAGARAALHDVPDESRLTEIAESERRLTDELEKRRKGLDTATSALEKTKRSWKELEEEVGSERSLRDALVQAQAYAAAARKFETAERTLDESKAQRNAAAELHAAASERERAEETAHERAQSAYQEAQRRHMAHALREHLEAGMPCPVCEQDVARVPARRAPKSLESARAQVEKTKRSLEQARVERASAAKDEATLESALQSQTKLLKELGTEVLELHGSLGPHAEADDPAAEITARLGRVERAKARIEVADRALDDARAAHDEAREEMEACTTRRAEVASALIKVCDRAGIDSPRVGDPATKLVEAAASVRRVLVGAIQEAESAGAEAKTAVIETEEALLKLRAEAAVPEGSSIQSALTDLAAELGARTNERERLKGDLERRAKLLEGAGAVRTRLATLEQLHKDLAVTRFVSFLLTGRKRLLAELASERLSEMTNGRYRFTTDGDFDVIDALGADTVRSARSLSGGETFLASLALALGLADAVGRHGGRLQCFFLDEGFGSLDAESFDRALDGIEHLVSEDRLIALVSHLPALSERVDDKIELERDETGSTRMVAGARL